jgi:hypothetical protein
MRRAAHSGGEDRPQMAAQPGKMLLIDTEQGRIIEDEELKRTLAEAEPYESG